MNTVLKLTWVLLVAGVAQTPGSRSEDLTYWEHIRSLKQQDDGHSALVVYLKSLTPSEMLAAARQSCEEAADYADEAKRAYAADLYVGYCLEYYFDNCKEIDDCAKALVDIVSEPKESPWFRHAIIELMSCTRFNRFVDGLQTYVEAHQPEVNMVLEGVVKDRHVNALLRGKAMSTLVEVLRAKVITICATDPNVRAVKERTHKIVAVGEMVRSGELTLTEGTWKQLKPIEERILANAKVLGAILADKENEPDTLRARAKFMLESYERLPLTQHGRTEVEKALASAGE